jgi:hypothetical protein
MTPIPASLVQMFLAIVAAVAALFVSSYSRLAGDALADRLRGTFVGAAVIALWLAVPGLAAQSGMLSDFSSAFPPFVALMLALFAATVALAFSPIGTRFVERAPLHALIGYQVFRIPLEFWLHHLYARGAWDERLTWSGLNFDVYSGMTALVVASLAWRRQIARKWILAWNTLAFVSLVNVLALSAASLPTPLRVFADGPGSALVATTFPFVWLPAFLVQAALFGHVLVWRWLARNREAPQ